MARMSHIGKTHTNVVTYPDGSKVVILHSTEVIKHWPERRKVRFNTGGWATSTTRTRMNQACNVWNLPLSVSFRGGKETVQHLNGTVWEFKGDVCEVTY